MPHIPYGYKVVAEKACCLDEETSGRVLTLYEEYVKCGSILAAGRAAGINKVHGSLGRILRNEAYLGTDFYPQLISKQLFEKAQQQRAATSKRLGRDEKPTKPVTKEPEDLCFEVQVVKRKFSDPYEQAAYAYEQIKEVKHEE